MSAGPGVAQVPPPPSVDLSPLFAGIRDQAGEGACTGMSTAAVREILWGSAHGKMLDTRLAPAYLYARTRIAEGSFPRDAGACMADEFAVLQGFGVCPEIDMPYDADPTERPSNVADAAAPAFRIDQPATVDMLNTDAVKQVLAAGMPIGIAIPCYQSFEDCGSDGVLTIPDTDREALLGGHGLCICGYDTARKAWRGINSWGTGFGDHGYFWMPEAYGSLIWEAWTARAQ